MFIGKAGQTDAVGSIRRVAAQSKASPSWAIFGGVGALAAFVRVKRAGFKPSLNLLYALEGAILGCHWQEIPDERRSELVLAAGDEVAKLPLPKNKRMPAAAPVKTVHLDGEDEGDMPGPGFGFDDPSSSRDD